MVTVHWKLLDMLDMLLSTNTRLKDGEDETARAKNRAGEERGGGGGCGGQGRGGGGGAGTNKKNHWASLFSFESKKFWAVIPLTPCCCFALPVSQRALQRNWEGFLFPVRRCQMFADAYVLPGVHGDVALWSLDAASFSYFTAIP